MRQKLQYCRYLIQKNHYKAAILLLKEETHPDALALLYEIAESHNLSRTMQKLVARTLIDTATESACDILYNNYRELCITNYELAQKIAKTNDKRFVPHIIAHLTKLLEAEIKWRGGIVMHLISALRDYRDPQAIPVLLQVLEKFPLEYATAIENDTRYALAAAQALSVFERTDTNQHYTEWYIQWTHDVEMHLQRKDLLSDASKPKFGQHIYHYPPAVDYVLDKLETAQAPLRDRLVHEVFARMLSNQRPHTQQTKIIERVIQYVRTVQDSDLRAKIIKHLQHQHHEAVRDFMVELAHDEQFTGIAIQVLLNFDYISDEITRIVINRLQNHPQSRATAYHYLKYLRTIPTEETKAAVVSYIENAGKEINAMEAYRTIAIYARHDDAMFNYICNKMNHPLSRHRRAATVNLRYIGNPATGILISLLDQPGSIATDAIKALSSPDFADATPYIIELLLSGTRKKINHALACLKGIGTEEAYAAINAYYDNLQRTTTSNR